MSIAIPLEELQLRWLVRAFANLNDRKKRREFVEQIEAMAEKAEEFKPAS